MDVTDKAAAERALQVRTSVPTEGSWAWLPDDALGSRVHWRPKEYWQPGTVVDVAANLYGVELAPGSHGAADITSDFTIGRNQVVLADANSHTIVVQQDGVTVASYDASYGSGDDIGEEHAPRLVAAGDSRPRPRQPVPAQAFPRMVCRSTDSNPWASATGA